MAEEQKSEHGFVGETIIGDDVVASIAGLAAQEIDGVGSLGKSTVRRALSGAFADAAEKARAGVAVEVGKRECTTATASRISSTRSGRKSPHACLSSPVSSPRKSTSVLLESIFRSRSPKPESPDTVTAPMSPHPLTQPGPEGQA